MSMIDRMERRCGWMAFPGFLRFYAIFHALVFVLQMFMPHIGSLLEFNQERIMAGEVWRVVTFHFASSGFRGLGPLGIICFAFMIMIAFMISDSLERTWGVFRTTLFYYVGIIGLTIGYFIAPGDVLVPLGKLGSGFMVYWASFLAFATLFPKVEFLIMFIIPVQVRWLAWLLGAGMLFGMVGGFLSGILLSPVFYALALANYFFWVAIPFLRGRKTLVQSTKRRRKFETAKQLESEAFHLCETCTRTEQSHPQLEFRISTDGKEYCLDHLPDDQD